MPNIDKTLLTKRYYSVGEVAQLFGVSKSLVRYWESEFSHLKPHKNSKGERRFTIQNIEEFEIIYNLVKERGFTIAGAQNEIKSNKKYHREKLKVKEKLQSIKKFLEQMKDEL